MEAVPERDRAALAPANGVAASLGAPPREGDEPGRAGASVALVSGGVSYCPGGDADGWRPASVGLPLVTGDRLYAARGARLELRTAVGEIRLASATGLEAIALGEDLRRFYVWGGSASFFVRHVQPGTSFRVDTPNAAVTFERCGDYRIDVARGGDTSVAVDRGAARVSAVGVSIPLGPGDLARVDGIQVPVCDTPSPPCRSSRTRRAPDRVLPFRSRGSR